ncbi:MAG: hypothetical protein ACYDA1_05020 [Vulcanimicrobiaceae bacterium]
MNRHTIPRSLGALVLLASTATFSPVVAQAASHPCRALPSHYQRLECRESRVSAPGDEYFGRMKLSYLGIENTFHDTAIQAGTFTTNPGLIGRLNFANESLQDWTKKYPKDPELARAYFLAVRVYSKVFTQTYQQMAYAYMNKLATVFPTSYFGKLAKRDLKIGFTEHWFAPAVACGAPQVTLGVPTAPPGSTLKFDVMASPCLPTPSPSPTASPGGPGI